MIIVPDTCKFLFTPRTGSRAVERAFLDHVPGAYQYKHNVHHIDPKDIPDDGLPTYAVIRDPYTQVRSWYSPWAHMHTIEQFVNKAPPGKYGIKRLNYYDDWVDWYFVYEDGLEAIFSYFGFEGVELEVVGKTELGDEVLTPSARVAIEQVFARDVRLYDEVARTGIRRAV